MGSVGADGVMGGNAKAGDGWGWPRILAERRCRGQGGGVTNGFRTGDRGRERTAVGLQVEDISDKRIVEGVVRGVDIEGQTHWR